MLLFVLVDGLMNQNDAKKRSILKRYLILKNVDLNVIDIQDLKILQALVLGLHKIDSKKQRSHYAWPLNKKTFLQKIQNVPYVRNLVAIKKCFGPNAKITYLDQNGKTIQFNSIQDFINVGWINKKYQYLDQYLHLAL